LIEPGPTIKGRRPPDGGKSQLARKRNTPGKEKICPSGRGGEGAAKRKSKSRQ